MNTKNKILAGLFSMAALFSSCNDFQEINEDPNQVDESKVKPEWFLNASIVGDQMNPEIAERMFILTWNRASRSIGEAVSRSVRIIMIISRAT